MGFTSPPMTIPLDPAAPTSDLSLPPSTQHSALSTSSSVRSTQYSGLSTSPWSPEARIWQALRAIEDPELPVSLVDMGLIVSVAYDAATRRALVRVTFTSMGCPAIDMIQDDIKERLLRDPEIDAVTTEVTWDPVWSRKRLSESARTTMRGLGIAT